SFSQGTIHLWHPSVSGAVDSGNITAHAVVKDAEGKDRFIINAMMNVDSNRQIIALQDGLMLNYHEWSVAKGNKIVLEDSGFYADQLKLTHNTGSIALQSEQQHANAPLNVTIENFMISDIAQIVQQDTQMANGIVNSKVTVTNHACNPSATRRLTIE